MAPLEYGISQGQLSRHTSAAPSSPAPALRRIHPCVGRAARTVFIALLPAHPDIFFAGHGQHIRLRTVFQPHAPPPVIAIHTVARDPLGGDAGGKSTGQHLPRQLWLGAKWRSSGRPARRHGPGCSSTPGARRGLDPAGHGRGDSHRPKTPQSDSSRCDPRCHYTGEPRRPSGALFQKSRLSITSTASESPRCWTT